MKTIRYLLLPLALFLGAAPLAAAQPPDEAAAVGVAESIATAVATDEAVTADVLYADFEIGTQAAMNHLWTLIAAILVFFMQAGFACLEGGFCRAKNVVNIIMKNTLDAGIGLLTFYAVGFAFMFGGGEYASYIGLKGFFLSGVEDIQATMESGGADLGPMWPYTFWMFQAVFAATAATIVSGAVAERIKFTAYFVYSVVIIAIIYPIQGAWFWGGLWNGGGWLEAFNVGGYEYFVNDFAGSTVVHSTGGWAALAGAIVLGPRIGKYSKDGKPRVFPGHNMLMASLGAFILFFGWFGFNAGSTTTADDTIGKIAMVTALAAAAGSIGAMLTAWIIQGKPEVGMTINGILAGLVSITAGCASSSPNAAILTGLIGGVLVVAVVMLLDQVLKIDDPVGAFAVHGACGVWGTLAAAIFMASPGDEGWTRGGQIVTHLVGIGANAVWAFGLAFIMFFVLKQMGQLRVSEEEELEGLDYGEHGASAYPDFTTTVLN